MNLHAPEMFDDFYADVEGLPQRTRMCFDCPARPLSVKKEVKGIFTLISPKHRCHDALNTVCAGILATTEEEKKKLMWQLMEESVRGPR